MCRPLSIDLAFSVFPPGAGCIHILTTNLNGRLSGIVVVLEEIELNRKEICIFELLIFVVKYNTLCPDKKWTPKEIAIMQQKLVRFV